jgi:eukaryotic-like serine/threonine-protein kinase
MNKPIDSTSIQNTSNPETPALFESTNITKLDEESSNATAKTEQVLSQQNTLVQQGGPSEAVISLASVQLNPDALQEYEIIQEIARGGMGVVHKARQKKLNRVVALKMILPHMLADRSAIDRFYQEARAAAALDHPNIVPIYEIGEVQGQHFFTMAFIEGESLKQRIKRSQALPISEAVRLLIEIASGVGLAHQNGIIHRDLKPENVLIDLQNRPRITDFGLAKQVESNSGLTATGQVMGTPSFMSPEQALGGKRIIGPPTDVYALGAILFTMLTGKIPFEGDTVTEVLCKVVSDPAPSLREANPNVPESLEQIYQTCLRKEPKERYFSANELRDALITWVTQNPEFKASMDSIPLLRTGEQIRTDGLVKTGSIYLSNPTMSVPTKAPPKWVIPVVVAVIAGLAIGGYLAFRGGSSSEASIAKNDPEKKSIEGNGTKNPNPVIEMVSTQDVVKAFASMQAKPKAEQQFPLMKPDRKDFGLQVESAVGKVGSDGVLEFKLGQHPAFRITPSKDAYIGVWTFNSDGSIYQLFPHENEPNHLIRAGETRTVLAENDQLDLELSPGIDQLWVIASSKKWEPIEGDSKIAAVAIFQEVRSIQRLAETNRGIIIKPKNEATVSEDIVHYRVTK